MIYTGVMTPMLGLWWDKTGFWRPTDSNKQCPVPVYPKALCSECEALPFLPAHTLPVLDDGSRDDHGHAHRANWKQVLTLGWTAAQAELLKAVWRKVSECKRPVFWGLSRGTQPGSPHTWEEGFCGSVVPASKHHGHCMSLANPTLSLQRVL